MPFGGTSLVSHQSIPLARPQHPQSLDMDVGEGIFSACGPFVQQQVFFKTSLLDMEMEIIMTFNKLTCSVKI